MEFQQTNILSMTGNDNFATTGQLANYVDLTSAQTISGVKTFSALPVSSVVPTLSTQLVNKNYVDGLAVNYVDLTSAQTISGLKTFSANLRLNNSRALILGTTYPTAGGYIIYTTPNLYYDVVGGGYHNFFIAGVPSVDIDSGGLVIRTSKKVQFFTGSWIYEDSGGNHLDYNTPTGFYHSLRINNVEQLRLDATRLTLTGDMRISAGKKVEYTTAGTTYTTYTTALLTLDTWVPIGNQYRWLIDSSPRATLNATRFTSVGHVQVYAGNKVEFDITGSHYITEGTNTLDAYVPTGSKHRWLINSVEQLNLDAGLGAATFAGSIRMKTGGAIFPDDTYLGAFISGSSGGIRFDTDTGGYLTFVCDSTLAMTMTGVTTTIPTNGILQFGAVGSNITYVAATGLRYNIPTSFIHSFRVNAVSIFEVSGTGVKVAGGYLGRRGTGGVFAASYNNAYYNGAALEAYVDNISLGNFTICDYRLKENIRPAGNVLDRLCQVEMIEYQQKDISIFKNVGNQFGFLAHQVKELFPELDNIVLGEKDALTSENGIQPQTISAEITNLYLKAIQELNAKIEAQQAQIDGLLVAMAKLVSQQIV